MSADYNGLTRKAVNRGLSTMGKWHRLSNRWIVTTGLVIVATVSLVFTVPAVAQEYTVLFNDDFESGNLTSWRTFSGSGGQANLKIGPDGSHWLYSINDTASIAGDPTWTDYHLKVKFFLLEGKALLRVRFNSYLTEQGKVTDYYAVVVYPGGYSLLKGREQLNRQLTELAAIAAPIKLNSPYLLAVFCMGDSQKNTLSVQLLDEQQNKLSELSYEDKQNPIPSGAIVLGTLDKSQALFDNVSVVQTIAPAITTASPQPPSSSTPATSPTVPQPPSSPTSATSPTTSPITQQPTRTIFGFPASFDPIGFTVAAIVAIGSLAGYFIAREGHK